MLDRERIARMDEEGYTMREITEEMSISAASVCRILKAHRRTKLPEVM